MKAKSMFILAVLMATMPSTLPAATKSGEGSAKNPVGVAVSAQDGTIPQDGTVLNGASTAPIAVPRGSRELLQDYGAEMAGIAQKFSATLVAITEAVQRGQLTSEQG